MIQQARRLRRTQTRAESRLWKRLRDRQFLGYKFRRQRPVPPFIADFACNELKLIIEVDGSYHAFRKSYDDRRTAYLNRRGYQVIRYCNGQVLNNLAETLQGLAEIIIARERELGISRHGGNCDGCQPAGRRGPSP